jgi:hypothetical protein
VHARIERNWAGVFLYDMSRNGIYVNGNKVEDSRALADGDRITVAVPGEDPDRPLLVYAAEGSTSKPAGPILSTQTSASPAAESIHSISDSDSGLSSEIANEQAGHLSSAGAFDPGRAEPSPPARKGGWIDQMRDNLLLTLVLIVSALALLTVLVWGVVLLRG